MQTATRTIGTPFLAEETTDHDDINIGQRLRVIRAERGLSIKALAELSRLNVNTLSLIENGRTSPSVSTLQQLSQSLKIPISSFFEVNYNEKKLIHQKNGSHPSAVFSHGRVEDLGAGMARFGAEPIIVTLKPRADSGPTPIVHTGREFVYCLEGKITYIVNGEPYVLEPGDSLLFEAYLPHQWKNPTASPSRALLVLCPMDSREKPAERHFLK